MELIHTIAWMKEVSRQARSEGRLAGLVPTMGALHAGHLSLVKAARRQASPVMVSLFVNPKQFGPSEDFNRYPRPLETDREMLAEAGADIVFVPTVQEMYPPAFATTVNVEGLSERLEGKVRPGHFRGVTTVVLKLLEIAAPRWAYFGRKDAQQVRIIRQMAQDLELDCEIVTCPIVRDADGLALSSRNAYLSPEERRSATALYHGLDAVRRAATAGERDAEQLLEGILSVLAIEPLITLEYAELVDADSFERVTRLRGTCLALVAVRIGATRLIDNLLLQVEGPSVRCEL